MSTLTQTQIKEKKSHKELFMQLKHQLYNQLPKETFKAVMEMTEHYYCYREPLSRYEILVDKAYRRAGKVLDLKEFLSPEEAEELRIEEERLDNH